MLWKSLNKSIALDGRHPVGITKLSNKIQVSTERYDCRLFGVGLLVTGYDSRGLANFFNCKALSIGSRSQSTRSYLEKYVNSFQDCTKDELIVHGLNELHDTLPTEGDEHQKCLDCDC